MSEPEPLVPPVSVVSDPSESVIPAPAYALVASPQPRPAGIGIVAMIVAISVFVLSIGASVVLGRIAGPLATRTSTSFYFDGDVTSSNPAIAGAGLGMLVQILLGSLFGVWALVQGIVAVVIRRGRAFGVIAIVVAALAPGISLVIWFVVLGVSTT